MMDGHRCKLCSKTFANGRALGGHMRSHMLNLPICPAPDEPQPPSQLGGGGEEEHAESASSSEEEEAEQIKLQGYGLRENPKKSVRLADPEFAVDAGSVVLQDRESETESSKNPTRRRSKRATKCFVAEHENGYPYPAKKMRHAPSKIESFAEPEPVSSLSEETTEEDVAFCLMMLSRDKWKREKIQARVNVCDDENGDEFLLEEDDDVDEDEDEDDDDDDDDEKSVEESDESEGVTRVCNNRNRGQYKCETCKKTFRSYQALGGHRASHKKIKLSDPRISREPELEAENVGTSSPTVADNNRTSKVHECPYCFRVFSSGQALGGHKRSHSINAVAPTTNVHKNAVKLRETLIDLNLPAPAEEDEDGVRGGDDDGDQLSQIELSALSEAEFLNRARR